MEECLVGRMGRSTWKFQRGIVYSTGGKVRDLKSNEFCCKVVRSLTLETFKEIMDYYVFWLCKREHSQGFPGGPMVKNPPCTIKKKKTKESGLQHAGHGFNPWLRKILHAEEQLSRGGHNYWVRGLRLLKPSGLQLTLPNSRSHHSEEPSHLN